jgi:hypothetical protein
LAEIRDLEDVVLALVIIIDEHIGRLEIEMVSQDPSISEFLSRRLVYFLSSITAVIIVNNSLQSPGKASHLLPHAGFSQRTGCQLPKHVGWPVETFFEICFGAWKHNIEFVSFLV